MGVKELLERAVTGEAKAALRLKVFAEKAEQEGFPQVARLFRVIAFSEEIHGARNLKLLKEIKSTEENLEYSFRSEEKVARVAYDEFIKAAYKEKNNTAATLFTQARDVETFHAKLYKKALNPMVAEEDQGYYVCRICGYVSDTTLPDTCPVCKAGREHFEEF